MGRTVTPEEFAAAAGTELEPSDWLQIEQSRVDGFARATEDFQFIHVDPARAAKTPFGGTIAHGFLTLSLLSHLNQQHMILPEGLVMAINYGSDKVRYLQPVRVGDRVRTQQTILQVERRKPGQWLCKRSVQVEIEGRKKPALTAEILTMYVVS